MSTLQELRKAKYKTVKAFAVALHMSPSKAGMILQGRYLAAMSVPDRLEGMRLPIPHIHS